MLMLNVEDEQLFWMLSMQGHIVYDYDVSR